MKVLILGAGHDQIFMIRCVKQLGYEAWVADRDPQAPGISEAEHPLQVDTADVDALERVIQENGIDGVCTMATNLAPRTVAELGKRLKLPAISPVSAYNATEKARFRALCKNAGLPIVEGGVARTLEEAEQLMSALKGPVILKPSDSSGCRGIAVVEDPSVLEGSFASCMQESLSGEVVIERYHEDTLVVGVETLVHEGQAHIITVADKIVRHQPCITTAGVTIPTELTASQREQLNATIQQLHEILGLNMGASHIDLIRDGEILRVIDVGPRLAGGPLIHHLTPNLCGVDMIRFVIEQSLGFASAPVIQPVAGCGIERFLYTPFEGVLEDFFLPELSEQMTMQWRKTRGSVLRPDSSNTERLGYVTAIRPDKVQAEAAVNSFVGGVRMHIRDFYGHLHECSPLLHRGEA